jgi:hypothetical protein
MMHKDRYGIWWDLPESELCSTCGQPDNSGDCTHAQLPDEEVGQLGGIKRFWFYPHDAGLLIFGLEKFSSYEDDNEMIEDATKRGYIFGEYFSVACPEGELGSNHESRMMEIAAAAFVEARANGWEATQKFVFLIRRDEVISLRKLIESMRPA